MLSMKFPQLFLRPEIIITFLWGWEWSGGQVRHRSPRNSGMNRSVRRKLEKMTKEKAYFCASDLLLKIKSGDSNSYKKLKIKNRNQHVM